MEKGWIKLYRQIFDCSIWSSREAFDKRSAWIDILLSASHKDVKMLVDGKTAIIPRGSFMFSIEKLSVRLTVCEECLWVLSGTASNRTLRSQSTVTQILFHCCLYGI